MILTDFLIFYRLAFFCVFLFAPDGRMNSAFQPVHVTITMVALADFSHNALFSIWAIKSFAELIQHRQQGLGQVSPGLPNDIGGHRFVIGLGNRTGDAGHGVRIAA
jgi:hypothetical protein